MSDQSLANRVREAGKLFVRAGLQRFDLEIGRGSWSTTVVRTASSRGLDTVLDVGANIGQYASLLRQAGFEGTIVSCEPLSGAFARLATRASGDPRWDVENVAVGARVGTASINVSKNSFSSSLRPMTRAHLESAPGSRYLATEQVAVTTVADLVRARGLRPASTLLKVDTQGFEGEVLAGAGELMDELGGLQVEMSFVELYDGQLLYDDLMKLICGHGFRLHSFAPGFSAPDGRLLQVDGLFVRSD